VFPDVKLAHLRDVYLDTLLVVLRIDIGFYFEARGSRCCPDIFAYGLETIQGAPRPVFADFTEEPVFDGIPLSPDFSPVV